MASGSGDIYHLRFFSEASDSIAGRLAWRLTGRFGGNAAVGDVGFGHQRDQDGDKEKFPQALSFAEPIQLTDQVGGIVTEDEVM